MQKSYSSLSSEEFTQAYMGILQPLEAFVVHFYQANPNLHDHDILRVYENLLKLIRAKITNFPLPQNKLEGVPHEIYNAQSSFLVELEQNYSLEEIQACLKKLEKSVKFWNAKGGSRGYLNHISMYM